MGLAAIFFDVGGVLVDADLERYAERAARVLRTDQTRLKREVALRVRDLEKGQLTSYRFWTDIADTLNRPRRPRKTVKLWPNLLKDRTSLNGPLYRLVQVLARQGVTLGVLSNVIEDHARILRDRGVYLPFTPCLLSCESQRRKPEPEFYKMAIKRAMASPGNCLLVDDNVDNLGPAQRAGMRVHHYTDVPSLVKALQKHGLKTTGQDDPWLTHEDDYDGTLEFCLNYAVLAPSPKNRQPWRFQIHKDVISLNEADNPEDELSLGAAWHFLKVALTHFGYAYDEQERTLLTQRTAPLPQRELQAIPYQRGEGITFDGTGPQTDQDTKNSVAQDYLRAPRKRANLLWTLYGAALARQEAQRLRDAPQLEIIPTRNGWFQAGQDMAAAILNARVNGLYATPTILPTEVVLKIGYGPNVTPPPRRTASALNPRNTIPPVTLPS